MSKDIEKLLFNYRTFPHLSTGFSPALLFSSRDINTGLPKISKPLLTDIYNEARENDNNNQEKMNDNFNAKYHPTPTTVAAGDEVCKAKTNKSTNL